MRDINDVTGDEDGSDFHYRVFNEGVRSRQPLKDAETRLLIMPAFGDPGDPLSWAAYRNPEANVNSNGDHPLSTWIVPYDAYMFIGKRAHFLDPREIDKNAPNPVGRLVDYARKTPRYYDICGLNSEGKKNSEDKDAFKRVLLQESETFFAVNAVCLNPAKEEDAGVSCVYSLKKTMVNGKWDVKETGLRYALGIQNRNVRGAVDPADFAQYYYWGDITDISALIPTSIHKVQVKSAGGGKSFPYYNMAPDGEVPSVKGTRKMLETRRFLPDAFNKSIDPQETLEILVSIFEADHRDLLRGAFESQYPGFSSMLKQTGVISSSRVHQAGVNLDDNDQIPDLPAPTRPRSFAPAPPATTTVVTEVESEELPAATGRVAPTKVTTTVRVAPAAPAADDLPPATPPKTGKAVSKVGSSEAINAEAERIRRELQEAE